MRLIYVCLMSECVNIWCSSAVCLHVLNYESRRISLPIIIIIFRKNVDFVYSYPSLPATIYN